MKAGESLSLQFHNEKDEAWYVLEGRARLELGEAGRGGPRGGGDRARAQAFHFPPGTVHRLTALEDTRILEVSTPQLDDVVRLEDNYGREGTSDPERGCLARGFAEPDGVVLPEWLGVHERACHPAVPGSRGPGTLVSETAGTAS